MLGLRLQAGLGLGSFSGPRAPLAAPPGPLQGTGGTQRRGAYRPVWASPASFPPPETQVPLSCGKKADRLSRGAAGSCALSWGSSCSRLDNPGCVLGNREPAEAPWLRPRSCGGCRACEAGGGASRKPLSLGPLPPRPADRARPEGMSPVPSERGADCRLHGQREVPGLSCILSLWRPHPRNVSGR